jgi:hypothetical protein
LREKDRYGEHAAATCGGCAVDDSDMASADHSRHALALADDHRQHSRKLLMQLRCKICQAVQPVTQADEADEDPRAQSIRRAFRAEHVASCGDGAVAFELPRDAGGVVEVDGIFDWAKTIDHPADVTPTVDGYFTREILRDGQRVAVRVCEGCWQVIPRYVDFPFGLVSPESDGDAQGQGAKTRRVAMETAEPKGGLEHLRIALCVPCYLAAFQRVYPSAALPDLSTDVIGDGAPIEAPPPPADEAFAPDPLKAMLT